MAAEPAHLLELSILIGGDVRVVSSGKGPDLDQVVGETPCPHEVRAPVIPVSSVRSQSKLVVSELCDTLVTLNPDTGAIEPGLAESWEIRDKVKCSTFSSTVTPPARSRATWRAAPRTAITPNRENPTALPTTTHRS